jgi:hypothetical protein
VAKSSGFGGFSPSMARSKGLHLDPEWERLRVWMAARGALGTSGIAVVVVNEAIGLRGIVATKTFKKGDEVLSVPRNAMILCESRADASPIREVYAPTSSGSVSEACAMVPACVRTALLLLWLSYSDPEEWTPSFDILPTAKSFAADGGPLELWSSNEVEACGCLILEAQVAARQSELMKLYDEVRLLICFLFRSFSKATLSQISG